MWTAKFWKDAVERAVKTAAQVAGGLLVGLQVTTGFDWQTFLVGLGVATGLSFVTSLLSSLSGSPDSASLVKD
jgi:Putative lactococcus lactis phage r1t holin